MQSKTHEITPVRENNQDNSPSTPLTTTPHSDLPEKLNDLIGAYEKGSEALGIPVGSGIKQFRRLLQVAERMMSQTSSDKITNFALGNTGDVLLKVKDSCDTESSLENAICGAVGGVAQVGTDVLIARYLKLFKIPHASGVSMYQNSVIRITAGAVYGVNAQHATSYFASLVGDLAEEACHKAFEIERTRQNGSVSGIIPPDFSHCVGGYFPPLPVSTIQKTTNPTPCESNHLFKETECWKKAPRFNNNPQLDPMIIQTRNDWVQQTREPLEDALPLLSNDDIRNQKKRTQCIYVITDQGEVLISPREHYIRVDSHGSPLQITHADLAQGKPVIGAGIVVIKDGKIYSLNEDSGHYRPHDGDSTRNQFIPLKTIVENAFIARGLSEANEKFYYLHGYESDNSPIYPSLTTTTPLVHQHPFKEKSSVDITPMPQKKSISINDLGPNKLGPDPLKKQASQEYKQTLAKRDIEKKRPTLLQEYATSIMTQRIIHHGLNPFKLKTHLTNNITPITTFKQSAPYGITLLPKRNFVTTLTTSYLGAPSQFAPTAHLQSAAYQTPTSTLPDPLLSYYKASLSFGQGYAVAMTDFSSTIRLTGLNDTYNTCNPSAPIKTLAQSRHHIGGVASELGVIKPLLNTPTHASIEETGLSLCLPQSMYPFSAEEINQIAFEVERAYKKDKTMPFFSLHFNQNAELFLVIAPAYKGTLLEKSIILLDYWMKGFLNGGIFDEEFLLKTWAAEGYQTDETYLRRFLIDLKQYTHEHAELGLSYYSLRELLLKNNTTAVHDAERYDSSFRLIFKSTLQQTEQFIIPRYDVDVRYTIESSESIENFKKQYSGAMPALYYALQEAYEKFALEIKETFSKMPFCQKYFQLFGFATNVCHISATCDAMGQEPVYSPVSTLHKEPFPKSLPPIPVRYYKKIPVALFLHDVLRDEMLEKLRAEFITLITQKQTVTLSSQLQMTLKDAIMSAMQQKTQMLLPNTSVIELNNHVISELCDAANLILVGELITSRRTIETKIEKFRASFSKTMPPSAYNYLDDLTSIETYLLSKSSLFQQYQDSEVLPSFSKIGHFFSDAHRLQQYFEQRREKLEKAITTIEEKTLHTNAPHIASGETFIQILEQQKVILSDIVRVMIAYCEEKTEKMSNKKLLTNMQSACGRLLTITQLRIDELSTQKINKLKEKENLHQQDDILTFLKPRANTKIPFDHIEACLKEQARIMKHALLEQECHELEQTLKIEIPLSYPSTPNKMIGIERLCSLKEAIIQHLEAIDFFLQEESIAAYQLKDFKNAIDAILSDLEKNSRLSLDIKTKIIDILTEIDTMVQAEHCAYVDLNETPTDDMIPYVAELQKSTDQNIQKKIMLLRYWEKKFISIERLATLNSAINAQKTVFNQAIQFVPLRLKARTIAFQQSLKIEIDLLQDLLNEDLTKELSILREIRTTIEKPDILIDFLNNVSKKKHQLCEHYIHSMLGFTNSDFMKETGEMISIVGGCGIEMDALEIDEIPQAERFLETIHLLSKTDDIFTFDEQEYRLFHVPIRQTTYSFSQNEVHLHFEQLLKTKTVVAAITPAVICTVMDESGASFLHYAAAMLPLEMVKQLTQLAPQQLQAMDDFGHLPIHMAVEANGAKTVDYFIRCDRTLMDRENKKGVTPLLLAIQNGHKQVVSVLLKYGISPTKRLPNGLFPLYLAIQHYHVDIALQLLDVMPTEHMSDALENGMTALHLAIEYELFDIATRLIQKGASLSACLKANGFTPFHCAIEKKSDNLVQLMLTHDPDLIHITLKSFDTPLHIAAKSGCCVWSDSSSSHQGFINFKNTCDDTPFMIAIKSRQKTIALAWAPYAKINLVDANKKTASRLALEYDMPEIADLLWAKGEKPFLPKSHCIEPVVSRGDQSRTLHLLQLDGIRPIQEFQKRSLITIAAHFGHFHLVHDLGIKNVPWITDNRKTLIDYLVRYDEYGHLLMIWNEQFIPSQKALLEIAVNYSSIRCAQFLLQNLSLTENDYLLYLTKSILSGSLPLVMCLLKKSSIDINTSLNTLQDSPLHLAVRTGAVDIVVYLLEQGADVLQKNQHNKTVFHLAIDAEDSLILKRLFKLTPPSHWPDDLIQMTHTHHTESIHKILIKYRKKIPREHFFREKHPDATPKSQELNEYSQEYLRLKQFITTAAVKEILDSLNQSPELMTRFHSNNAGILFGDICLALSMHEESFTNQSLIFAVDNFFRHLKKIGFNPKNHLKEQNILERILSQNTPFQYSCIELVLRHFPDALAYLMYDATDSSLPILQHKFPKEFMLYVTKCQQQHLPDRYVFSALHYAVLLNDKTLLKSFLTSWDVDSRQTNRETPLMLAAKLNQITMMELLVHHGANLDCVDVLGKTALHHAISSDSEDAALFLLSLLKQKNKADRVGKTPLMLAAEASHLHVINALCSTGDYTNEFDHEGYNALHWAAIMGTTFAIRSLIQYGFFIDAWTTPSKKTKTSYTPLHLAVSTGHVEATTLLLELGANPYQADSSKKHLIEHAIFSKNQDMISLIQPLCDDKTHLHSLLEAAVIADDVDTLHALLLNQATLLNLNLVNIDGHSLLHLAAIHNSIKTLKILLECDEIPVDLWDKSESTALHYAAMQGQVRNIELLIEAGASIDQCNGDQQTALFLSCEEGHLGAVVCLLRHQANYLKVNADGMTPAQVALSHGHTAIVCRLTHDYNDESCTRSNIQCLPKEIKLNLLAHYNAYEIELHTYQKKPCFVHSTISRIGFYKPARTLIAERMVIDAPVAADDHLAPSSTHPEIPKAKDSLSLNAWDEFCINVKHINIHLLNSYEKHYLLTRAQYCFKTSHDDLDREQYLSFITQIKERFGSSILYRFITFQIENATFKADISFFQKLLESRDELYVAHLLREKFTSLISNDQNTLLIDESTDQHHADLNQALARFKSTAYPLPDHDLDIMKSYYLTIMSHVKAMSHLSKAELIKQRQYELQSTPQRDSITINPKLIALVYLMIKKTYQMELYNTQVLSLLSALLIYHQPSGFKGRISQINTGQGKSKTTAALAIILAWHGYNVDVVITADYLAERDFKAHQLLFQFAAVTDFVRYKTNSDLEFEMLGEGLYPSHESDVRTLDFALIDEIDSLILDQATSSARMAIPTDEHLSWVYAPILEFVRRRGHDSALDVDRVNNPLINGAGR